MVQREVAPYTTKLNLCILNHRHKYQPERENRSINETLPQSGNQTTKAQSQIKVYQAPPFTSSPFPSEKCKPPILMLFPIYHHLSNPQFSHYPLLPHSTASYSSLLQALPPIPVLTPSSSTEALSSATTTSVPKIVTKRTPRLD